MHANKNQPKQARIVFIVDERLSRDRRGILSRAINAIRPLADVELLHGETTEEQLLKKLEAQKYALVLAPWYRYQNWSRIEGHFGLTRTSGPTFAGYFAEPLQPHELGNHSDPQRAIFLDFTHTHTAEIATLIRSLLTDTARSGIRPLLDAQASVYCETWVQGQGMGSRIDAVMATSEISGTAWAKRAGAIRILLMSLWSLVYEEGPGKNEFTQTTAQKVPRAYLQMGADGKGLFMRLCYNMPSWSSKDALAVFWPKPNQPLSPFQLLLKYADFVRVHTYKESSDIEVLVGLLASAPSEAGHNQLHTLWIEPLRGNLVTEPVFEQPSAKSPHLKALVLNGAEPIKAGSPSNAGAEGAKARDRFIFDAAVKLKDLKKALTDRDSLIKDLRSGGVGSAPMPPPPDAEGLLSAFQERYFEARLQIRQFELQIAEIESKGASAPQVKILKDKMQALVLREQEWIRTLAKTLETYRAAKQGTPGTSNGRGT